MAVVAFIETPRLELPRGWVYDVEPLYNVAIIERGLGAERRNLSSQYPRTRISVTIPADKVSDIPAILEYWHAARGRAAGFRVQDPTDYLSCELDGTPASTDQPLAEISGAPGTYQMLKRYTIGAVTQDRIVSKPVASSIIVANDSAVAQVSDRWSLDAATGIITPNGSFVGTPATWGGQFDLPVRFDSELPLRVENFRLDTTSFALIELTHADS